MSLDSIKAQLRAYLTVQAPGQASMPAESFGTPDVLVIDGMHNTRRFFVMGTDEFLRGTTWAQKTPDEIMADMRALVDAVPERDEAQRQADFERYNRHLFTQSGPPPIIPIPHRPPQLAPEEVPRVVAKARAVAVFGPKRGRWK